MTLLYTAISSLDIVVEIQDFFPPSIKHRNAVVFSLFLMKMLINSLGPIADISVMRLSAS